MKKTATMRVHLCLMIIALFGMIQSASAVAYNFSQLWDSGGLLTGRLEIDESKSYPGLPDICYYNAVTDFNMHWSGNAYSDPFDWVGQDSLTSIFFVWSIPTHSISSLGTKESLPIFVSGSILADYRGGLYWSQTTHPLVGQVVPDGGSTLMFLGIALPCLALLRRRFVH
jgi:hypothetical protein